MLIEGSDTRGSADTTVITMMECILWSLDVIPDVPTLLISGSERTVVCFVLPVAIQVKIAHATIAIRNIRNCSNFLRKVLRWSSSTFKDTKQTREALRSTTHRLSWPGIRQCIDQDHWHSARHPLAPSSTRERLH